MIDPDVFEWQLADVLTDEQAMFILWTVKSLFCTRRGDFLRQYEFAERKLDDLLHRLKVMGFLQEDSGELILTEAGEIAISRLGIGSEPPVEENLVRVSGDIQARFNLPKERIYVENRFLEQLRQAGWLYPHERDPDTPYLVAEGRDTYRDVLLKKRLKESLRRINQEEGSPGSPSSRSTRQFMLW